MNNHCTTSHSKSHCITGVLWISLYDFKTLPLALTAVLFASSLPGLFALAPPFEYPPALAPYP